VSQDIPAIVSQVIRDRRTVKVFAATPQDEAANFAVVEELLEAASWAPFHRGAAKVHLEEGKLQSKVPWRAYVLEADACRVMRERLLALEDKSKVPPMLGAATHLVQVTWLPDPPEQATEEAKPLLFEPTEKNMEHIAATGAAIQNLLLAATARGIPSYWSSGGALRQRQHLDSLGIPASEILLGSVFLFPPGSEQGTDLAFGGLREQRGKTEEWSRRVELG
jgi:nitroreductase